MGRGLASAARHTALISGRAPRGPTSGDYPKLDRVISHRSLVSGTTVAYRWFHGWGSSSTVNGFDLGRLVEPIARGDGYRFTDLRSLGPWNLRNVALSTSRPADNHPYGRHQVQVQRWQCHGLEPSVDVASLIAIITTAITAFFSGLVALVRQKRIANRDREDREFFRHIFDQNRNVQVVPALVQMRSAQSPAGILARSKQPVLQQVSDRDGPGG